MMLQTLVMQTAYGAVPGQKVNLRNSKLGSGLFYHQMRFL